MNQPLIMSENVKLNLYEIVKCGYYEDQSLTSSFCSLPEMLNDLQQWIQDKELQETKTYGLEDYQNHLPTYCLDLVRDNQTGDYLLTTWNETPTDQGNYASINLRSSVGQYELDIQKIPKGYVPGYATYFWFIPDLSRFCTIRFSQPLNGHPNLKLYLKNYLKNYSGWVFDDGGIDEREIIGYGTNEGNIDLKLNPIFDSRPAVKTGDREFLRRNAQFIRKVMRKNRVNYVNRENLNFVGNLFRRIGINNDVLPEVDFHDVKFEIDREFTEVEIVEIFDYWLQNIQEDNGHFDDIGFKFTGNSDDYWLSRIIQKMEFEIDVIRRQEEVVEADSLLTELIAETREHVLALV
ncbi:MAG: hypothetical protein WD512_12930 [Candidatus Paceibacterota bacterium]